VHRDAWMLLLASEKTDAEKKEKKTRGNILILIILSFKGLEE